MYRKHHNGQLSIEEFHVPFGGTLDPENRWVLFSSLMPWEELEATYAPQFSPTTGAPAKPVRLAFGALFIKQRLGLTDEETVEQIRENAYMQFFLGFASYSIKAPFDPSMMVHFRKRFSEEELSRVNELIAERGKAMVIEAIARLPDDDESDDPDDDAGNQLSLDNFVKPADWPEGKPWGTLTVDASCTPADITYPTDLKLLNEARESTERIIDDLCEQHSDFRKHKPRYDRGKARAVFLSVAKQKKPRRRKIKAAIRRQLDYLQRNLEAIDALIASGAVLSSLGEAPIDSRQLPQRRQPLHDLQGFQAYCNHTLKEIKRIGRVACSFDCIAVSVIYDTACFVGLDALSFHHPLQRGLAVHDVVVGLQGHVLHGDVGVVDDGGLVLFLARLAEGPFRDAVERLWVLDVGQAQVALLDRDRVGFDGFIVHMHITEFAARAAEGPEVGGGLHAGDAGQFLGQVVGVFRAVILGVQ